MIPFKRINKIDEILAILTIKKLRKESTNTKILLKIV